jgi:hypothetical protein
MATTSQTFNASGTFTWPAGIRWAVAEVWGGGGGGGSASGNPAGGGGGAGGAYARKRFERPSAGTDTVTVGIAVATNVAGNVSWFRSNNALGCVAPGGATGGPDNTGNNTSTAGATGSASGAVGDVSFAGGNGGTGASGTKRNQPQWRRWRCWARDCAVGSARA